MKERERELRKLGGRGSKKERKKGRAVEKKERIALQKTRCHRRLNRREVDKNNGVL